MRCCPPKRPKKELGLKSTHPTRCARRWWCRCRLSTRRRKFPKPLERGVGIVEAPQDAAAQRCVELGELVEPLVRGVVDHRDARGDAAILEKLAQATGAVFEAAHVDEEKARRVLARLSADLAREEGGSRAAAGDRRHEHLAV